MDAVGGTFISNQERDVPVKREVRADEARLSAQTSWHLSGSCVPAQFIRGIEAGLVLPDLDPVGTGRRLAGAQRAGHFDDAFKIRRIDILAVVIRPFTSRQ
jgi:hypothetical protein